MSMTHNGCTCHTSNTVVRMLTVSAWRVCSYLSTITTAFAFLFLFFLCSRFLGGHSGFFFKFLLLLHLPLFGGKSSDFILKSSFISLTCWSVSPLWLASSRNWSRFQFFWMLLLTSSLSLMVCTKCSSILSSVCSPNSQSFDFSRSRAAYVTTLSPATSCDLFLLVKSVSGVMLVLFW